MDLGQEILCKGIHQMSDRRNGVAHDRWDANMLRAVRHVTPGLAEEWLNDLARQSHPYGKPCSFIESRDFTPAVVVCEPEIQGNNMDPEGGESVGSSRSAPADTHVQPTGRGVIYSATVVR